MESKIKLLGHALHPMLIVFPLGLLGTSVIFDIIYLISNNPAMAEVSYWMIVAGLIGGLVAAIAGWLDWAAIPNGTRAKLIGLWHGVGNMVVTTLFAASWLVRFSADFRHPDISAQILSFIGLALALVTGWLGGELVDRMAVGVDRGAHLDSLNSLSGRPATESAKPGTIDRAKRPATES